MIRFENVSTRLIVLFYLLIFFLPFAVLWVVIVRGQRVMNPNSTPTSTDDTGLVFRLSEGREESKQGSRTPNATPNAEPLSDEAAQNLLKRVPQIKSEVDDEKDF